jgi:hypothetical protein
MLLCIMHNKCYDVSRDIYGETLELCQCFKHMPLRIMHNKCYDVSRDIFGETHIYSVNNPNSGLGV